MIQRGDILAVRGNGWFSDGIAQAEYGNAEPEESATHIGVFVAGDPYPVVTEALQRVVTNPLHKSIAGVKKAYVLSPKNVTDEQRNTIVDTVLTFSADDYGYLDIGAQWLNARFGTTWFTDNAFMHWYLEHWQICSYVGVKGYESIGLNFGISDDVCRPSDILSFAIGHPGIYDIKRLPDSSR